MIQAISVASIKLSGTNPRSTMNADRLAELTESVRAHGVLQPVLVRPNGKGYELVAGHRRHAAALAVGLDEIPAMVRELDDKQVLEIQVIENLQRADLSPLDEAQGYKLLITKWGYTAERIAERIGMSLKYVYDRVKLLELVPEARQLVVDGRITAGHAILLARLKPADQKKAIDPDDGGCFQNELGHDLFDVDGRETEALQAEKDPYKRVKARSVRELEAWIDDRVRFKPEPKAIDPILFPETAQVLTAAAESEEKVIHITHDYHVREEAKDGKTRTWGPMSWERADGQHGSKVCEYSITGVVVVGPERGQAFKVCVSKEKCKTHWAQWQKDRAKRAKASSVRTTSGKPAEKPKWQVEQERDQAKREAFKPLRGPLTEAIASAIMRSSTKHGSAIASIVLDAVKPYGGLPKAALKHLPNPKTAEDVLHLAALVMLYRIGEFHAPDQLKGWAKRFSVDVAKVATAAGVQTSAKAAPAKPKKLK